MVTRCVNLELVQDKTCESFLMSLQRHCAENGKARWILSDNANEYIKANDELKTIFNSEQVKRYYFDHSIKWKFSPKRSPQHNSVSESLIKVAKSALYGIFGKTKMTETEFSTAIKLAQNRLNSRPLIGMSDDPRDQNLLTITPHHLKLGRPAALLPSSADDIDADSFNKIKLSIHDRWTKRKLIQQAFFIKWKNEYVSSLSKAKRRDNTNIKKGAVVLLLNERHARSEWPLARIEKVFKSADGVVRSVQLRLPLKVNETKKTRTKNASDLKNKLSLDNNNPRFTTRGVENICILEEATVTQQHPADEADNDERTPNTNNDSNELEKSSRID